MAYDNVDEAYLIELVPPLSDTMKLPPKMARYESEKFQPGFFFLVFFVFFDVGCYKSVKPSNQFPLYLTISGSYILKHQQNICH